jgi:hypothetical protein
MYRRLRVFDSFDEADEADALFRSRMTPGEGVDIFFEIREIAQTNAAEP